MRLTDSIEVLQEQRIAADKGILWHFPRQEYVDTVDIFADKGIGGTSERSLHAFSTLSSGIRWKPPSGKSTCQVRFEEAEVHGEKCGTGRHRRSAASFQERPGHCLTRLLHALAAVFSGNISLEHPYEGLRTGYASMFQSVSWRFAFRLSRLLLLRSEGGLARSEDLIWLFGCDR